MWRVVVESQWQQHLERTISDVIHHLNGRIMGLRGVLYAMETEGVERGLSDIIESEMRRVEQFVIALQALPRGQEQAEAPFPVIDAVNQAVTAKRLNRMVSIEARTPRGVALVMRAAPNEVVKAVLLLLRAATENRKTAGTDIMVELVPEPHHAAVVISAEAASTAPGNAAVCEARDVARRFAGVVKDSLTGGVFTAVLHLPLVPPPPEP